MEFLEKNIRKNKSSLIVLTGLALRLMYAGWMGESLLENDAQYYVLHAGDILAGINFEPEWPPGLSYYLVGFQLLFGAHLWTFVAAMLLLYLIFSFFLYKTLRLFFEEKRASIGLAFFTLSPTFIHHSVAPLTQLPIALFLLALIYFLIKKDQGWKIGLCLALTILTRAGSLAILPVVVGYLMYQKRYQSLPGLLAILIILIGTWQYKSYQMTDRWIWINDFNSFNFYIGNNASTPPYKTWWLGSHDERDNSTFDKFYEELDILEALARAEQASAFNARAWDYIKKNPSVFLRRSLNRFRVFFAFDTYTGATIMSKNPRVGIASLIIDGGMFMLLGLGFLLGLGIKGSAFSREYQGLLLLFILFYTVPYLLAFSHPSYHLPISPLMAFFAMNFFLKNKRKNRKPGTPWIKRLLLIFFLFIQIEWVWHMSGSLAGAEGF